MKKIALNRLIAAAGLFGLILASPTPAQETGGNLSEAWYFTVKRGEEAAFETAFKAHAAVRAEHGDPRSWDVFVPVTGDRLNRYSVRTCCFAWPEQDAYEAWYRQNPEVMGQWQAEVAPHIAQYEHYFFETDGPNSHWTADGTPVRFVGVTDFHIAGGQGAAFAAARTELSQIAINQGWTAAGQRWAWLDRIGGQPMTVLAVPFENYADMAPEGPGFIEFLSEHMGADAAAALLERLTGATLGSEYSIWAHRPDLTAAP